jgi:hypothetical protein
MSTSLVKKTAFEELDTVAQQSAKGIDNLFKEIALFSPYFAFSDTQLIDNAGLRQAYLNDSSSITKLLFTEDPAYKVLGPTIEVCHRPQAKVNEQIFFERVIEHMIAKSKEPMLFSSLNPATNKKIRELREKKKSDEPVSYDEFISLLHETELTEATLFKNYVKWLNTLFNEKKHCSRKEWNFKTYATLVATVLSTKESLENYNPELKTPSAVQFHNWIKEEISKEQKPDRTPLRSELQKRFSKNEIRTPDKEIYEHIIDFPYNYNLVASHDYAFIERLRPPHLTRLFLESGLIGSRSLEQTKSEQIKEFMKKYRRPRKLKIEKKINFNAITYDDIIRIRTSEEFRSLLIRGFLKNDSPVAAYKYLEEYIKFLSLSLPKESVISQGDIQMLGGSVLSLIGLTFDLLAFIIGGVSLMITGLGTRLSSPHITDRDLERR